MSSEVKVIISAQDGASRVFKTIGASASGMAKNLQSAGQSGSKAFDGLDRNASKAGVALDKLEQEATQAGTAIQRAGQQTQTAGRDWAQFEQNATKAGTAIGTVTSLLAKAGQASVNETNSIRALRAAYGDSADELIRFSETIQDTTTYSNDAARASALFAQSLTQNYGISTQQIEQLVGRTADLAAVNGVTLYDAISRTSGAIRGEGEAAERLGLNMSDSAVAAAAAAAGLTGWNTTMSESEKAAFRFTVFLEQSNYAVGQAAAQADTAAGKTRQMVNEFQDFGTTLGRMSGPVGEVLSVFGDLALAGPLVGAGIGKAVTAIGKLRAGSALATAALGPYGLAAAGVALGVGLLVKSHRDAEAAIKSYDEAVQQAAKSLFDLKDQGVGQALLAEAESVGAGIALALGAGVAAVDQYEEAVGNLALVSGTSGEASAKFRAELEAQIASLEASKLTTTQAAEAQADWDTILAESGANLSNNVAAVDKLTAAYLNNEITGEQFVATLDTIAQDAAHYGQALLEAADANAQLTQRENDRSAAMAHMNAQEGIQAQRLRDHAAAVNLMAGVMQSAGHDSQNYAEDLAKVTAYEEANAEAVAARAEAMRRASNSETDRAIAINTMNAQLGLQTTRQREAADAANTMRGVLQSAGHDSQNYAEDTAKVNEYLEALTQAHQALADSCAQNAGIVSELDGSYQGLSVALGIVADDLLDVATAMQGINDGGGALQIADAITDAGQALDTVLSTFEAIDALGQRISATGKIATDMTGELGTVGGATLDLYERGIITVDAFNAAQAAGLQIQQDNIAGQDALNQVRAAQLPILAEANSAYTAELQRITELAPAQQALALAYMDSATQAKASELASMALSASMGQLGDNGQRVATNIISAASAADPVLKSLLTDMGLIEEGADGTIRVNFPDGDTVTNAVDNLRASVDALNVTLGGTPPTLTVDTEVTGPLASMISASGQGPGGAAGSRGGFGLEDQSVAVTVDTQQTGVSIPDIKDDLDSVAGTSYPAEVVLTESGTPVAEIVAPLEAVAGTSYPAEVVLSQGGTPVAEIVGPLERIDDTSYTATVAANDQASVPIDLIVRKGELWGGSIHTAGLAATDEASPKIAAVTQQGELWGGSIHTAGLAADDAPAVASIATTTLIGQAFGDSIYTSTLDGDIGPMTANTDAAYGTGYGFDETTFTSSLDGDNGPFSGSVGAAEGMGGSFAGSVFTASIDGDTSPFYSAVAGVNGSVVGTAYVNVVARQTFDDGIYFGGAYLAHGGTVWADSGPREIEHAAHGRAGRGNTVMVGEYGRELVTLPNGSFVTPHPATESRVREDRKRGGRGGDGGIRIQTLNLYPATPDVRGAIEMRARTAYRTG